MFGASIVLIRFVLSIMAEEGGGAGGSPALLPGVPSKV